MMKHSSGNRGVKRVGRERGESNLLSLISPKQTVRGRTTFRFLLPSSTSSSYSRKGSSFVEIYPNIEQVHVSVSWSPKERVYLETQMVLTFS